MTKDTDSAHLNRLKPTTKPPTRRTAPDRALRRRTDELGTCSCVHTYWSIWAPEHIPNLRLLAREKDRPGSTFECPFYATKVAASIL
jgi:hypothetical protein